MTAELLPLLEQIGDWWQIAVMEAGMALGERSWDPVLSDARLERATEAARRSENPTAIAFTAKARGRVAGDRGSLAEARPLLLEAIERYREIGAWREVIAARSDLAHAMRRAGSIDEAEAEYRATIEDWRRLGNRGAVANQLEAFAFVALAKRNGDRAARLFGAAEALREDAAAPMMGMERPEYDAEVDRLRDQLDERAIRSAWAEGRELDADRAVAFALSG